MAYDKSLAIKQSARIIKLVRQKAYTATLATIEKAAQDLLNRLNVYRRYKHRTGNTWTSTSIGIYYKGRLVSLFNKGAEDEPPTRVTLREGEVYDLPYYYKGAPVGDHPYIGEYGNGKQWGPTLGPWHVRCQHSPKYKTWNLVVAIPVSYAGYNPYIVETMQKIMDDLPNVVDYNIVRVENAPSQTDMFKDVPF